MQVRWYFQNDESVIGPVSEEELKYLINGGTLGVSTLVRRGDDGPWLAAGEFDGLRDAQGQPATTGGSTAKIAEWYFNPKTQNKQGPVLWSALKDLAADGKLEPDDLVWKPGMAMWVPAARVRGLLDEPTHAEVREARFSDRFASSFRHSRAVSAGVVAMILFGLIAAVVGWSRLGTEPTDRGKPGVTRGRALTENGGIQDGAVGPVEHLLDDARTDLRLEQLDRAKRSLDQYLASSLATQPEAAKRMLREINLVRSAAEAAAIARNLGDEPLKSYLRQGVQPLVAAIETAELRPIYEKTLLQAFRQENNRRQRVPKGPFAQIPEPVDAGPIAKNQPELARPAAQENARANNAPGLPARRVGLVAVDFKDVTKKPDDFVGQTLLLNGLYKIGTNISEVKTGDGQVLGRSLPVARNDDSPVFTGDRKFEKSDVLMLLDDRLAIFLEHVFAKLNLRTTIKPSYKCILTVTIRRLLIQGNPTPVVEISSMEVLGGCDYLSVARHQYSQAFRTLTVNSEEAHVDFGDGDLWVERLGGEENFVQPIRRKFREMQRRAVTNRDSAVIDRILQRELANVVSTATAINHIVAMDGLRRMRILP
jgi:hypothetical protein